MKNQLRQVTSLAELIRSNGLIIAAESDEISNLDFKKRYI
jgi:hypothetical protein